MEPIEIHVRLSPDDEVLALRARVAERPEAPPGGADGAEHTAEAPARRTGRPHRGGPEGRPRHAARRARGPGAAPCQPG